MAVRMVRDLLSSGSAARLAWPAASIAARC